MRHTIKEITEILNSRGYNLIQYISSTNILAIDSRGYKYKINLFNLTHEKQPHWLMRNPFALDNFKLYLQREYPQYELLDDEYINCKTKMRFICHNHIDKGVQYNFVDNIVNNHHACMYCGCEELWERKRTPVEIMEMECQRVGVNFVQRTSYNGECWVNYTCPYHLDVGVQSSSWTHFKEFGHGCPHCNKISKGENRIYEYLSKNNIPFEREYSFEDCIHQRHLKFDFYVPLINLIIEFNGKQHYEPVKFFGGEEKFRTASKRDEIKMKYCNDNNIDILIIPYWEYDNIEKILEPYVKKALLLCEKV